MHNHNQRPSYMPMSKKLPEQQNDLPRQENMRLCVLALRSQQPDTMVKVQICWVMGLLGAGCSEGTCVPCHSDATRHNQPSVAVQAPPPSSPPPTSLGHLLGVMGCDNIPYLVFRAMTKSRFPGQIPNNWTSDKKTSRVVPWGVICGCGRSPGSVR